MEACLDAKRDSELNSWQAKECRSLDMLDVGLLGLVLDVRSESVILQAPCIHFCLLRAR